MTRSTGKSLISRAKPNDLFLNFADHSLLLDRTMPPTERVDRLLHSKFKVRELARQFPTERERIAACARLMTEHVKYYPTPHRSQLVAQMMNTKRLDLPRFDGHSERREKVPGVIHDEEEEQTEAAGVYA